MILFFYGQNNYAGRHKLRQTIESYIKKTGSDLGLERFVGTELTEEKLSSALMAQPMLASSRLVVIEDLGLNKPLAEKIEKLATLVPESTVALFFESAVDQRTTYFKILSKLAKTAKFEPLNPLQLTNWITREVEKLGGTIDRTAASVLIDIVGDDQWRLEQEIGKLVNFDPNVTPENIKRLVVAGSHQTIFDLVDAMTGGRVKTALQIYRSLLEERTNEIYVLTMVIWQLRNLLLAKTAGAISQSEFVKATGISPYAAGKAMQKSREFDEETLKQAFLAAVETDYLIKSGKGRPDQLVEQLIYRVATV